VDTGDILAEYNAQFESDVRDIAAVTDSMGGGRSVGSVYKTFKIKTIAWQDLSTGEVYNEKLCLSAMREDTNELHDQLKRESIVTIKARKGGKDALYGFNIVQVTENGDYPELEKILKAYTAPVYHTDEVLGKFTFNRVGDYFEQDLVINGGKVRFLVWNEDGRMPDYEVARKIIKEQKKWDKLARQFAAKKLLDLKNENWLRGDEKPLSVGAFKKRLRLTTINVFFDGKFGFYYDDDDIFWGHEIWVKGTFKKGFDEGGI
jgi:hypothetical protein